jgi:hypothetical protein
MVSVIVFNTKSILSITTARRIVSVMVISFMLMYITLKDVRVLAQTIEKESVRVDEQKGDDSQSKSEGGLPSVESPAQREPEIIVETVEPVVESWENAKGFGEKIDWMHANLFKIAQAPVDVVDHWFQSSQGEQPIVELSRFRVGLFGKGIIKKDDQIDLKLVSNFEADIELPNLKRRLKLIITTNDPTILPGRDITEQQDKSLRTALSGQWMTDVSTAIGVRASLKSPLFAYAAWSPKWKTENWRLYPQQKFYWENENGFGEISTLVFDHWTNRWNTRFSTSIKWSVQDRNNDHRTNRKDEGFRWSEVFIFDHAMELLDETHLGRIVSGDDVAHGGGVRLAAFGGFHFADEYQAGLFYRWPLRKKWLYLLVAPDIDWKKIYNWNPEKTIKFGIEILFWGRKER